MDDKKKKKNAEEDYDFALKNMMKNELLKKVERRLNDNDPVVLNTLKVLINEEDKDKLGGK